MKKLYVVRGRERVELEGRNELYRYAFNESIRCRGAVYFGHNATAAELVADLEGTGHTVTVEPFRLDYAYGENGRFFKTRRRAELWRDAFYSSACEIKRVDGGYRIVEW